jgi:ATP-binding cassette subfamily C (CFTR/MRP) protein 1
VILLDRYGNISVHGKIEDIPSSLFEVDGNTNEALESHSDEDQNGAHAALPPAPTSKSEWDKLDLERKTGDMTLYAYYFRSIGWIRGASFLGLAIVYIFLGKFPRKSRLTDVMIAH